MWISKLIVAGLLLQLTSAQTAKSQTSPNVFGNLTARLPPELQSVLAQAGIMIPQLRERIMQFSNNNREQMIAIQNVGNSIGQMMGSLATGGPFEMSKILGPLNEAGILSDGDVNTLQQLGAILSLYQGEGRQCYVDIAMMLESLNDQSQFWAIEMLDASAKPGPSILRGNHKFLGNYKQCAEIKRHHPNYKLTEVPAHICRASAKFTVGPVTFGSPFLPALEWDLCLPKSCKGPELKEALNNTAFNLTADIDFKCTAELDITQDTDAIASITILSIFGLLVVAGTLMDVFIRFRRNEDQIYVDAHATTHSHVNGSSGGKDTSVEYNVFTNPQKTADISIMSVLPLEKNMIEKPSQNENLPMNGETKTDFTDITKEPVERKQNPGKDDMANLKMWEKAFLAFSLPRNTARILGTKAGRGNIGCLHGIRVLSLAWVILGHVVVFFGTSYYTTTLDVWQLRTTIPFQLIVNAPLAVDTFFFMSGFLTAYLFMKECGKNRKVSLKTMILYYVHRYWRLTPPMMIWVMITATLMQYVGEGRPAWQDFGSAQACRDKWWMNMLYINSFVKDGLGCVGVTWFLANDMIYYILAPLVLIPFVYRKNILGFFMATALIAVHIGTNIWLIEKYNFDQFRDNPNYSDKLYYKPWTRSAPYGIGLIFGWIMWKTQGKIKMNNSLAVLGWFVAVGTALVVTLVTYDENKDEVTIVKGWPMTGRLIHETFSRPLWAIVIGWIVLACASGYGGFINSILSWEGWLPLSRLSFGAYLVHLTIGEFEIEAAQANTIFTIDLLIYKFFGIYVMSYVVGYLLAVFVEMPLLGLEKAALK